MMTDTAHDKPPPRKRRKRKAKKEKKVPETNNELFGFGNTCQNWSEGLAVQPNKRKKILNKIELLDKRYFKNSKNKKEKFQINVESDMRGNSGDVWVLEPTIKELDEATSIFLSRTPTFSDFENKMYEKFTMN
jgi:hypothetical protein